MTQEIIRIIESNAPMKLEEIIQREVSEWEGKEQRKFMITGQQYYEMNLDILNRKRTGIGEGGAEIEIKTLSNNKLAHGFVRKLVDQKVGYLLSKPLSIQTENTKYQELLKEIFNKGFLRLLKNVGKGAINKGIAWLQVYYNDASELRFKILPSEEIIPLWIDAAHTELQAIIRVYEIEVYEGTRKRTVKKVEFWDATGVKRYMQDGSKLVEDPDNQSGSHFKAVQVDQEVQLNWQRIPIIPFKYNDEEIPLVKMVKSLSDDYDRRRSDNSNNLEDLPESIYVLKNYDGTDLAEARRNISVLRMVKVQGDGGVESINLNINVEAANSHLSQTRKDIYEFGRGVDTQSDKLGNSPSGIALRFLFADLDMDANIIETEFQASMEQLLWFVNQHLANTGKGDFEKESVEFIFNRDIIINETESITNASNSKGVISDETIVANHPWTSDTQEELNRIKKQKEVEMKYSGYGEFGGKKDPPEDDDE
ncbi:portal protein [Paenibacillus wynnii]|uniref:Portal protein n=1 Tax=Paenibacillus wynnii TaxID=268407 RepID=A0A098MEX9_9BACL|nr:portal protein [Paenibacillus wynnii]